jgi:hypothetical protein
MNDPALNAEAITVGLEGTSAWSFNCARNRSLIAKEDNHFGQTGLHRRNPRQTPPRPIAIGVSFCGARSTGLGMSPQCSAGNPLEFIKDFPNPGARIHVPNAIPVEPSQRN